MCSVNQTEEEIRAISHLDKVISVEKGDEDDNGGGGEGALYFPFSFTLGYPEENRPVITKKPCWFYYIVYLW